MKEILNVVHVIDQHIMIKKNVSQQKEGTNSKKNRDIDKKQKSMYDSKKEYGKYNKDSKKEYHNTIIKEENFVKDNISLKAIYESKMFEILVDTITILNFISRKCARKLMIDKLKSVKSLFK